MSHTRDELNFPGPQMIRRKSIHLAQGQLTTATTLNATALPLVIRPTVEDVDLAAWLTINRPAVESSLLRHGAILFRDFPNLSMNAVSKVIESVSTTSLAYADQSSPRSRVEGNIYTSTDYPADRWIFLHNENSYSYTWPGKLFFICLTPADSGGETPLADCRRLYHRIDPAVLRRFAEKGVMYVRNFGDGFGLPWQTVFQTDDRTAVETYCRSAGILVEWKDGNRLRTRHTRRAIAQHPKIGEMVWFNHATFFHISTLDDEVRLALLEEFDEPDLPYNTYYGDGSPIEGSVLEELRSHYRGAMVLFPWQEGDILLLDNMLTAHGRAPYTGPRRVVVGMADPITEAD